MGRMILKNQADEYEKTLRLNWINPVFAVQNAFNQIAGTEINSYHRYLAAAEDYATRRRYYLYNYFLNGRDLKLADYRKIPAFDFMMPVVTPKGALWLLQPVILLTVVLTGLAVIRNTLR